jgi:hypothetical protein
MMRLFLSLLLLAPVVNSPAAEQIVIRRVSELINPAEVIARVEVLSIQETGAKEGYTKVASVRVTDSIKGAEIGAVLELENDVANVVCPNVRYEWGRTF